MRKFQSGAITAIFLAVVALVLTLILAATQSQLLLSIRRSQSASDILIATYNAESEVNDIMARLIGGYLGDANIPKTTKIVGDIRFEIEGQDLGETQIVTVTATRGFAVGKVQATRRVQNVEEVDGVDIVLALDCTGSMDARDAQAGCTGTNCPTRFNAMEEAAVNFIDNISNLDDADKFRLGIAVFGINSAWLVSPDSGLTFTQIEDVVRNSFGDTRRTSQCAGLVRDGTSVGSGFRHGHDYFSGKEREGLKQIEVVITDGEPNSRIVDSECPPSIECGPGASCEPQAKNYLRCTVADNKTFVPEIGQNGVRNPDVDAYAVTIFNNPPLDVVTIFRNYATQDGYFNASQASQLTNILEGILNRILEDRSTVTVKRIIPTPQ